MPFKTNKERKNQKGFGSIPRSPIKRLDVVHALRRQARGKQRQQSQPSLDGELGSQCETVSKQTNKPSKVDRTLKAVI